MPPLTLHEAISGILGSISLASWIFLLVPQLIENYTNASADGISLTFLLIWFVGDVTNLVGAVWARLVPTVVALAAYFCLADAVLVGQVLWYRWGFGRAKEQAEEGEGERRALLGDVARQRSSFGDVTEENLGLPGSRRRSSAGSSKRRQRLGESAHTLGGIPEQEGAVSGRRNAWVRNTVSILAILLAGTAGWFVAYKTGAWTPTPTDAESRGEDHTPVGAEVLGYVSAVAYLGARIPQIVKNQKERSCEGLSLLFFLLSLVGNGTYGASVSIFTFSLALSLADPSVDSVPFRGEAVLSHEPAVVDRQSGHDGGRRGHLRSILRLRRQTSSRGRRQAQRRQRGGVRFLSCMHGVRSTIYTRRKRHTFCKLHNNEYKPPTYLPSVYCPSHTNSKPLTPPLAPDPLDRGDRRDRRDHAGRSRLRDPQRGRVHTGRGRPCPQRLLAEEEGGETGSEREGRGHGSRFGAVLCCVLGRWV
ncbi:vacuolar membrane PQ loop repeat protein [Teratosphaeria destructans]|uniref:Vacuolar membrane PQ loop repeat protein n=1 Tax=Teratosphaeria destructans TaxID=418781 RepID=A0A9W7SS15_9PEZI|nr:vacuolar membrane PQ loop repeat protein [Teratosphaeria destructans]